MRGARCTMAFFSENRSWEKHGKFAHGKLLFRATRETTPKAPARKPLLHRGGKP